MNPVERRIAQQLVERGKELIEDVTALAGIAERFAPKIERHGMRESLMMRVSSGRSHASFLKHWVEEMERELAKPEPQTPFLEEDRR